MKTADWAADRIQHHPSWPDTGGRPVLFLIDASSHLERRILRQWVQRMRPKNFPPRRVSVASIPKTRRRKPDDWRLNPRLWAKLQRPYDQLVVPLRVVWRAPERDGERVARWSNLLTGDPRDPRPLRAYWTLWRHPDRLVVQGGTPATTSDLQSRWKSQLSDADAEHTSFTEFVSLQASLALEVAERNLRGSRYKVPAFVAVDLMNRPSMIHELEEMAAASGVAYAELRKRAGGYLKEMAATHTPFVIDLVAQFIRLLIKTPYGGELHYDRDTLHQIYEMGQKHPLVFLPSHKSNLDHLVLQLALYENDLPPNHTAGGINMNFFPVGPLVRRSGVFFIRRTFKGNPLYKLVLKRYLGYLLQKRFSLEWYIEGGRSRSGKLRAPRFGLLGYVVDAYRRGASDDVVLIPVSIAYDQIQDVDSYAIEQSGGRKQGEGIKYMVGAIRSLHLSYGSIHLRFGDPISLAAEVDPSAPLHSEEQSLVVQKLAFEVCARINQVTPITPISLATLALLGTRGRALSVEQTLGVLEYYLNYVKQRALPTTAELRLDTPHRVQAALDALVEHGVVSRYDAGPETVYAIGHDEYLQAAYYRNTIIHFFVNGAIAELGMLRAASVDADAAQTEFWDEAMRFRDLLKFEFFFRRKDTFRDRVERELELQDPMWREHLAGGTARTSLLGFRPYMAHWVLRPFVEAYRVVADVLTTQPEDAEIEEKRFLNDCLALGNQYILQQRIQSPDAVSTELFKTGLQLAYNRGLVEPAPGVAVAREAFRMEILDVLQRIDAIEVLWPPDGTPASSTEGRHAAWTPMGGPTKMQAMFTRDSGIILHPTSLPGPDGIGDLGPEAYRWIDFLAGTGCGFWQVLPLGPTGYGDSPYQGFSAFAGNPYLVSPDRLLASGLLEPADLDDRPVFPDDRVDFGAVIPWKLQVLDRAFDRFRADPPASLIDDLNAFASAEASWLDDFCFFMALKAAHGGGLWTEWPLPLVRRQPEAIAAARRDLVTEIERHRFRQYLFFRQWARLRAYATDRGVRIVGDAPIFVAEDSADVWAHPDLFFLDERRRPEVVAGVPPDYFSATGQLWGNPLYDWERQRSDGYAWWIDRLRTVLQLVDVLRIDHFRGFVDYWEIPAGAATAEKGRWVDGPGEHFFVTIRAALGDLPIIAEDLGELHATVPALRDRLGLPGMKVVQFAFDGDPTNEFLPDRYPAASVVYTGTHDNDTTTGWFAAASEEERARVLEYLDSDGEDVVGDLLEAAWASNAGLAAAPLQDFLRLGSEARMNTPGRPDGNWTWRLLPDALTPALQEAIRCLNSVGDRTAH